MNVAAGLLKLLNCDVNVEGPLVTLQAPLPMPGVFAASVTLGVVVQMVWFEPALADVGAGFEVIVTCELDAVHGALLIVHWNTYAPAVVMPVIPDDAEPGVVIVGVTGPLMKLQAPAPVLAVLAAIVADPLVAQIVCGLPALAAVGGALTMIETFDVEAVQGALLIVQRRL